ncbi:MAG: hypothetical protein AB1742_02530 [bacterium]
MFSLETRTDPDGADEAVDVRQLVNIMTNILGASRRGNMPAVGTEDRDMNDTFNLDGGEIEIFNSGDDDRGADEIHDPILNDSKDDYADNTAPQPLYTDHPPSDVNEEEIAMEKDNAASRTLKLQGIVTGEKGKVAIINDDLWIEGDRLGEYRLEKIEDRRVFLRAPDGSFSAIGM